MSACSSGADDGAFTTGGFTTAPATTTSTTASDTTGDDAGTGDGTDTMASGDGDSSTETTGDGDSSTTTSGGDGDTGTTTGGDGDTGTTTGGDGDTGTTTGGDGDTTGTTTGGDGDTGTTTSGGDGDGDGDTTGTTTGGDGDGDGDTSSTTTSGGDGDGDGDTTSTTTTGGDGDGDPCGDEMIDVGEACDGSNLNGITTCQELDGVYSGGTLGCASDCSAYDVSACTTIPNPITTCRNPNQFIDDNSTYNDTFPGLGSTAATITDLDVGVTLTHTYIGDLIISVSGAGQNATLYDQNCGSEDNINATFSDGAATFACGQSNSGLTWSPSSSLSVFNGQNLGSSVQMTVSDNIISDTGTWSQWCLTATWQLP